MTEILVIALGCLLAAYINASFATGGVYVMLACVSSVLPMTVTIPLLSAFALPSLFARICLFWRNICWKIVKPFILGSAVGVVIGGQVFVSLTESQISMLIACLILLLTWWPEVKLSLPRVNVYLFAGISHSFIGTLFGIGGIIQPLVIRTSLTKPQVTGTLAACLFFMGIFKITSYGLNGFQYHTFWAHICVAIVAGFLGAWTGKRCSIAISEATFRRIFKAIITVVAIRLLYKAFVD